MARDISTPTQTAAVQNVHTFAGSLNPNDPAGREQLRDELVAEGFTGGLSPVGEIYFDARDFSEHLVVAIYSRGRVRTAVVEKVGRTNVTCVFTTPGAIADAERYSSGRLGPRSFTRKAVSFDDVVAVKRAKAAA